MNRARLGLWISLSCVAASFAADPPSKSESSKPSLFETHVRPIFKANCFQCHGEESKLEGSLDLRLVRSLTKGGESGAGIVPGDHAKSLLWQRIAANEMPPGDKKLSERDQKIIAAWIDAGAKTTRPEPEAIVDDEVTENERSFWSFQSIRRLPVRTIRNPQSEIRNPIDAFLLARLHDEQLSFSEEADRVTLIRRATFDLLGLPPTPDEVAEFVADPEADAYERLIDRLLESPHYGERWARHWLDVAGYADSDGFSEKDFERKYAFRYRDYIIRALNADRPWDELIVEQLAGDELLKPPFRGLTPEQSEKLIATGFLRMGPDGTADTAVDQNVARNECLAETIKIVSSALLGLTVGCAQCHSHRYDPISQVDYYRTRAIFEPAYNWKDWRNPTNRLVSLWTPQQVAVASKCDAEIRRLEQERANKFEALADSLREREIAELDDDLKQRIRDAVKTPVAKRTEAQKKLLTDYPKANIPSSGMLLERNAKDEYKAITEEFLKLINEQRRLRPDDDFAHCLTEVPGRIPQTFLFHRGEFAQPKQEVAPGELAVLAAADGEAQKARNLIPMDDPNVPTSGRRLAYARYLTNGRHPLVARVFVNRVWMNHFGRGLVATPADFGQLGDRPTHPELLDWLADEFMAEGRGLRGENNASGSSPSPLTPQSSATWSLKKLHRLIMTATAYRQSSRRRSELDVVDPDNRLLGRMSIRRLEAETVRDAMLAASDQLNAKLFGPPVPVAPDETGQIIIGVDTRDTAGRPTGKKVPLNGEEFRRSVYIQVRRSMPLGMLETFDAATLNPNCALRTPSTVAPQSLLLMNNEAALEQAQIFADRVTREAGVPAAQARLAWRLALSHEPTDSQIESAVAFLTEQTEQFAAQASDKKNAIVPTQRALASLCQALLISNGFLYVD